MTRPRLRVKFCRLCAGTPEGSRRARTSWWRSPNVSGGYRVICLWLGCGFDMQLGDYLDAAEIAAAHEEESGHDAATITRADEP